MTQRAGMAAVLALGVTLGVASCTDSATDASPTAVSSQAGQVVSVPLATNPRNPEPREPLPAAGVVAWAVMDEHGCAQLYGGGSKPGSKLKPELINTTVWPNGFTAQIQDGYLEILDEGGRVVADADKPYSGGGGYGKMSNPSDPCLDGAEEAIILNP